MKDAGGWSCRNDALNEKAERKSHRRHGWWVGGPKSERRTKGEFRVVDQGHAGPPYHINLPIWRRPGRRLEVRNAGLNYMSDAERSMQREGAGDNASFDKCP